MNTFTKLEYIFFAGSLCVLLGVFANNFSRKLGIPALLVFLGVGMLAGSDGPGGIWFDNAPLAQAVGLTALIFILFNGGLDTNENGVNGVVKRGLVLSLFGVIISTLLVAIFSIYLLNLKWWEGILLGSIVSSTDAVAVFSILRSRDIKIRKNLRSIIEFESASNDPMSIFLVLMSIQVLTLPELSLGNLLEIFFLQFFVGLVGGYAFGKFLGFIMNKIQFNNENFYFITSISLILMCYGLIQVARGSGLLAVYFAGLVLSNSNFVRKKSLIIFHDTLAWLVQVVMFLFLGLFVFPKNLLNYAWEGCLIALFLVFVARPLSVILCLIKSKFNFKEQLLISWGGFKGATPLVLALYPLTTQMPKAELIFDIIFVIVFISILIQAPTFPLLTKLLGLSFQDGYTPRFPVGITVTQQLKNHLNELIITKDSPYCGKSLVQINFPQSVRVVLIQRQQDVIAPRGTTVLEAEDLVLILTCDEEFDKLKSRSHSEKNKKETTPFKKPRF